MSYFRITVLIWTYAYIQYSTAQYSTLQYMYNTIQKIMTNKLMHEPKISNTVGVLSYTILPAGVTTLYFEFYSSE